MAKHGKKYTASRERVEREVPAELSFDQVKKLD